MTPCWKSACRIVALFALVSFVAPWSSTPGAEQKVNGRTFTVPEGFILELVAGPPLVDRPITAAFDELGRLYVADSSGTNDPVQKQLAEKPHRILRLEDRDGDGTFDHRTVFADQMMFPEGTMWLDGALYVAAPPSIWKLTDTNDDGVVDRREEWFQGKTLTGCANDLHGPYPGPDGWIYWAKGAFAQQTYERPGKPPFTTRAAHLFRARPDGTGIEPVMTGGMDNPVDIVFLPGGERFFTTTFLTSPGGGQRDGIIHAIYGGIYGKANDVTADPVHKWTSPELMPVLSHLGPAAPCGLVCYQSKAFGIAFQNNLFACCFNLHKLTRHKLTPSGASFTSEDEDFLSSEIDFHPTDVIEDADGSLLVVDTGGWYKLCCPTSVFHKPDVLGAIYRLRKQYMPRRPDPRGLKLEWKTMSEGELTALLDDARPAVRDHAIQALGKQGEKAMLGLTQVLQSLRKTEAREGAVLALSRIDLPEARAAVRDALKDYDEIVRHAAIHTVSVHRDRAAVPRLIEILKNGAVPNRRAAAEALGRLGDPSAVAPLLQALSQPVDRALQHSLTYALIEIGDRTRTQVGLSSDNESVRRAALIALDQMDDGLLSAAIVMPDLVSKDPQRRQTAAWIVSRHPEWADDLATTLHTRLGAAEIAPAERAELETQLIRFAGSKPIQKLLLQALNNPLASADLRLTALRVLEHSGLRTVPNEWFDVLPAALAAKDPAVVAQAVATARALPPPRGLPDHPPLRKALLTVADDSRQTTGVRLAALAALPGGLKEVTADEFTFLLAQLGSDQKVADRAAAVDVLTSAKLNPDQLGRIADTLATVGPLEAERLLTALEPVADDVIGLRLVRALRKSPALGSLRPDALATRLSRFGPTVGKEAAALYEFLKVDPAKQRLKLEQLLTSLSSGDVRRGQAVFAGAKAACASCHAIGYVGGKVGPDLTKIGQVRTERDLLESIAFPSATFVRSYEPLLVATRDGQVQNGVLKEDGLNEIVLALDANRLVRIPRSEIEEMRPGTVSVMPAGLDQQLNPQELADLVTFLKACK